VENEICYFSFSFELLKTIMQLSDIELLKRSIAQMFNHCCPGKTKMKEALASFLVLVLSYYTTIPRHEQK